MSITIKGEGMVFAKDRGEWTSYTMGISSKNQEGKWVNAYVPVRFRKGESVANKTKIKFKAFPVVKEYAVEGQNRNYIIWQILDFAEAGEEPQEEPLMHESFTELSEEDIPF